MSKEAGGLCVEGRENNDLYVKDVYVLMLRKPHCTDCV